MNYKHCNSRWFEKNPWINWEAINFYWFLQDYWWSM